MRTVSVVVTARPSYARVRTVLEAMDRRGDLTLHIIAAASALLPRYGRVVETMRRDFPRHHISEVYSTLDGDHHGAMVRSAGLLAVDLTTIFGYQKPDIVLTIADRYETLGTSMAASYMNIPLAHLQGGEITGSIDDKVRNAVTMLADVHFVSTDKAAARVAAMRQSWRGVHKTGCPSLDIARKVLETRPDRWTDLFDRYGGVGPRLDLDQPYYVVLQHPVTTHAETSRQDMLATLLALRRMGKQAVIFWPNVDTGSDAISKLLREYRESINPAGWHFFRHVEAEDFLHLVKHSAALIGNSSVGIRECSFMGVPVVNIGDRQDGRECGLNVLHVRADETEIVEALAKHEVNGPIYRSQLYGDGHAGETIAKLLATVHL